MCGKPAGNCIGTVRKNRQHYDRGPLPSSKMGMSVQGGNVRSADVWSLRIFQLHDASSHQLWCVIQVVGTVGFPPGPSSCRCPGSESFNAPPYPVR